MTVIFLAGSQCHCHHSVQESQYISSLDRSSAVCMQKLYFLQASHLQTTHTDLFHYLVMVTGKQFEILFTHVSLTRLFSPCPFEGHWIIQSAFVGLCPIPAQANLKNGSDQKDIHHCLKCSHQDMRPARDEDDLNNSIRP